jgi:hypothetical protein
MQPSPTVQRLVTLLIALLVAFLLSSVFSPPDPSRNCSTSGS